MTDQTSDARPVDLAGEKPLARAIFDPGFFVPRKEGEAMWDWQARAGLAALRASDTSEGLQAAREQGDREGYRRGVEAAAEWRDMDSAPLDGTPLLLFARAKTATAPIVLVGWYLPDEGWIECSFTKPVGIVPLAWMPRPAFPALRDYLLAKGE